MFYREILNREDTVYTLENFLIKFSDYRHLYLHTGCGAVPIERSLWGGVQKYLAPQQFIDFWAPNYLVKLITSRWSHIKGLPALQAISEPWETWSCENAGSSVKTSERKRLQNWKIFQKMVLSLT